MSWTIGCRQRNLVQLLGRAQKGGDTFFLSLLPMADKQVNLSSHFRRCSVGHMLSTALNMVLRSLKTYFKINIPFFAITILKYLSHIGKSNTNQQQS